MVASWGRPRSRPGFTSSNAAPAASRLLPAWTPKQWAMLGLVTLILTGLFSASATTPRSANSVSPSASHWTPAGWVTSLEQADVAELREKIAAGVQSPPTGDSEDQRLGATMHVEAGEADGDQMSSATKPEVAAPLPPSPSMLPSDLEPILVYPVPNSMAQANTPAQRLGAFLGQVDKTDKDTKYLAFLPHGGFHNQRISVQNALVLSHLLNRTLLLPPIWVGWPSGRAEYTTLQTNWVKVFLQNLPSFGLPAIPAGNSLSKTRWYPTLPIPSEPTTTTSPSSPSLWQRSVLSRKLANRAVNLDECKSYSKECKDAYPTSFLAWDWLTDLGSVETGGRGLEKELRVEVVDRWDIRERMMEKLLGVGPEDMIALRDHRERNDYHLYADGDPDGPIVTMDVDSSDASLTQTWTHAVSIPALAKVPQQVIVFGSLFSHERISGAGIEELRGKYGRSLAFRTPHLLVPADAMAARLGGRGAYLGIHARVDEGGFKDKRFDHMERVWKAMVEKIVGKKVADELWETVKPTPEMMDAGQEEKRSLPIRLRASDGVEEREEGFLDDPFDAAVVATPRHRLSRRAVGVPWTEPTVGSLTCRGPLHTEEHLLPLNTPLYIATDARRPLEEASLQMFWSTFPCSFIFDDFDKPTDANGGDTVAEIAKMRTVKNGLDGVDFGRLFVPFLEVIVAAMGVDTYGTPGSTFSQFAEGDLHDAYAN